MQRDAQRSGFRLVRIEAPGKLAAFHLFFLEKLRVAGEIEDLDASRELAFEASDGLVNDLNLVGSIREQVARNGLDKDVGLGLTNKFTDQVPIVFGRFRPVAVFPPRQVVKPEAEHDAPRLLADDIGRRTRQELRKQERNRGIDGKLHGAVGRPAKEHLGTAGRHFALFAEQFVTYDEDPVFHDYNLLLIGGFDHRNFPKIRIFFAGNDAAAVCNQRSRYIFDRGSLVKEYRKFPSRRKTGHHEP